MHISKSSVCWDLSLSRSRPTLTVPQLAAVCSKPLMWKRSHRNTRVEPPTLPDSLISLAVNSQAESPCLRCTYCFQPRILSFFTHLTPTVFLDPTLVSPLHGALPEVSMVNIQPYQTFWVFTTLSPSSLSASRKPVSDTEYGPTSISTCLLHNCKRHGLS